MQSDLVDVVYKLVVVLEKMCIHVVARVAIVAAAAFIISKTPDIPNIVWRFAFFFALGVPVNLAINYTNVWLADYHVMSWTWILIISLGMAAFGTYRFRPVDNTDTAASDAKARI